MFAYQEYFLMLFLSEEFSIVPPYSVRSIKPVKTLPKNKS